MTTQSYEDWAKASKPALQERLQTLVTQSNAYTARTPFTGYLLRRLSMRNQAVTHVEGMVQNQVQPVQISKLAEGMGLSQEEAIQLLEGTMLPSEEIVNALMDNYLGWRNPQNKEYTNLDAKHNAGQLLGAMRKTRTSPQYAPETIQAELDEERAVQTRTDKTPGRGA